LIESSTSKGRNDKIVNTIIIASVVIIGPIAFSTIEENVKAKVQTMVRLIYAKPYADIKRQITSFDAKI
jgi:hypothetical protein